jgi:AraC family transcriptional regulator
MDIACAPRDLIIKPPEETHFDHYGPASSKELAIEVTPERLKALYPFSRVFERVSHITRGKLPVLALQIYKEFSSMDSASVLAIEGLLLETMAEISRYSCRVSKRRPPWWLSNSKEFLREHFSQSIKLSDVAAAVDVHPVSLAREFRKFYGCTVGDYIRQLRIEYSCQALSTSSTPLFKIACEAGFSDHSHFSRTFKHFTGVSPSQYRSIVRKR